MNTITKVEIDLCPDWDNSPKAVVWLGEEYDHKGFRFEERDGSYRAEREDGIVSFYFYNQPGEGFGGCMFHIQMLDGEERVLRGPWSSNAESINQEFQDRKPVIEARLMEPARSQEYVDRKGKRQVCHWPPAGLAGSVTIEMIARHMGWPEDMTYAEYMIRLHEMKRDFCARSEKLAFRAERCQEVINRLAKTGSQFGR